ncbi:hypothetical protein JNJ66_03000 [Candidatus Saccharibacteria bacterium]|nr:hypothetical protein [Candidatus Saccharibacteria bacterium]
MAVAHTRWGRLTIGNPYQLADAAGNRLLIAALHRGRLRLKTDDPADGEVTLRLLPLENLATTLATRGVSPELRHPNLRVEQSAEAPPRYFLTGMSPEDGELLVTAEQLLLFGTQKAVEAPDRTG